MMALRALFHYLFLARKNQKWVCVTIERPMSYLEYGEMKRWLERFQHTIVEETVTNWFGGDTNIRIAQPYMALCRSHPMRVRVNMDVQDGVLFKLRWS